jgi:hypothetical protein
VVIILRSWWGTRTVPELLFEKKGLIPAIQRLLTSYGINLQNFILRQMKTEEIFDDYNI